MSMEFNRGKDLLEVCEREKIKISKAMFLREINEGEKTAEEIEAGLDKMIKIMRSSSHEPIKNPEKSLGGLIGGEGRKIMEGLGENEILEKEDSNCSRTVNSDNVNIAICGNLLTKAIAYAMAVLEVNGTMGLIVAAPTAGSSGIIPGCFLAISEEYNFGESKIKEALLNASAIGYLFMKNGSVSGADAGCQAEVGAAAAMAASGIVELLGGSPKMCLNAASFAVSNLLGLVCDPILGLVESPCQSRNAIGVSNAFSSAQLSLSGINHVVPFDEMVEAMTKVGRSLPFELRETALGGNAATPTACSLCRGK